MDGAISKEDTPAVCGVILLRSDGAALLQHRDEKPEIQDPGLWVFPGGHVNRGESLEAGARREFLEETSYRCAELQELIRLSGRHLGYNHDFLLVFYWCRFDGQQAIECHEGQELRFVNRGEAVSLARQGYLLEVWDAALAASGIRVSGPSPELLQNP